MAKAIGSFKSAIDGDDGMKSQQRTTFQDNTSDPNQNTALILESRHEDNNNNFGENRQQDDQKDGHHAQGDDDKDHKEKKDEEVENCHNDGHNVQDNDLLRCPICAYTCVRKQSMTLHVKKHEQDKPYSCQLCSQTCPTPAALALHAAIHLEDRPFQCPECPFAAKTNPVLKSHMKRGHALLRCQHCPFTCVRRINLTRHQTTHKKEKVHSCSFCDYVTNHKQAFQIHINKHTKETSFSCDLCDFKTPHKLTLKRHTKSHEEGGGEKIHRCTLCPFQTNDVSSIKYHKLTHNQDRPHACPSCPKTFKTMIVVKHHIADVHIKAKKFSCHLCTYKATRKAHLETHMLTHTGEKPFACKYCDFRSSQKPALKSHERSRHTNEKPFQCLTCGYQFAIKYNLKMHQRTHEKKKEFFCEECPYSNHDRRSFRLHRNVHLAEKKRKTNTDTTNSTDIANSNACKVPIETCTNGTNKEKMSTNTVVSSTPLPPTNKKLTHNEGQLHVRSSCPMTFPTKIMVKQHEAQVHDKKNNLVCHLCKYRPASKRSLDTHMLTHEKEKPFTCRFCEFRSKHKYAIKRHERNGHSEEKPFQCMTCYQSADRNLLKRQTHT